MYFLGVRIAGSERAGTFAERNSKSISEKVLTSALYNRCTAPMQSIEVGPVPIHAELSVHWLLRSADSIVESPCDTPRTALDTIFRNAEKMMRRPEAWLENM